MAELEAKDKGRKIAVRPIMERDIPDVALFLHRELNRRISAEVWAAAIDQRWADDAPNHGFMLIADDQVVGVQLAFYANRTINGRKERFCNLAAWCVQEPHRSHGFRLLSTLLAQKDCTFTDLSPSGNVVALNSRLKFRMLNTSSVLVPNLPWLGLGSTVRIETDKNTIAELLEGENLQIFRDHERAPASHHLVATDGASQCYVIFRRDRRKRMPFFASILFVSNPAMFGRVARLVFSHLLTHHGILATIAERRVIGEKPAGAIELNKPRVKMFRSTHLQAEHIDNLYSELTSVPW